MKLFRWLVVLVLMLLLGACSGKSGTGIPGLFQPATTLPAPAIGVTHAPSAEGAMRAFLEALKKNDFTAMYALLTTGTQESISPDDFTKKYNDSLNSMSAANLDYEVLSETLSPSSAQVGFRVTYHTVLFGDMQRDMNAHFTLEQGQWRLQWDSSLILPELTGGNLLKTDYQIPARGDIYDRKGLPIVTQSDAYALGIEAGSMSPKSEGTVVAELALLCHTKPTTIQDTLDAASVGWYVPVCDASVSEVQDALGSLPGGVTATPFSTRFYLAQGIAPQIVGYASLIQKEHLSDYRRLGYRGDEKVGQMGIEYSMEQYLAGKHGGTLYVVDPNGQVVSTLSTTAPQPADSIYLTLDSNLQL